MNCLTSEKLAIAGAGSTTGSNMVQTVLTFGLTPSIYLCNIYESDAHGMFGGMEQRAFPGADLSYTADPAEVLTGAKYIISSGDAPRKEGTAREDLLKGNCKIATDFNENIKKYCPNVEHVVVTFDPADVTALTTLIHSGLKPNQLTSLVVLDSTRLRQASTHKFGVQQDKVIGACTYDSYGEQMVVFAFKVKINRKLLTEMSLSAKRWEEIKHHTVQDGSNIIKLHDRSSFQSPAYNAVRMIEAAMGGEKFTLPAGYCVNDEEFGFKGVTMAISTTTNAIGAYCTEPTGTPEEMVSLQTSYEYLCKMCGEIISLDIVPTVAEWKSDNTNS